MSADINARLVSLHGQGLAILSDLETEFQALDAPIASSTRRLLADGGGHLVAELFGTTKARRYGRQLTADLLKGQRLSAQKNILGRHYVHYQNWLREVLFLLSQISVSRPNLKAPGNSQQLITRVNKAERYKKLDTRIRHVLAQIEEMRIQSLVWNYALHQATPRPARLAEPDPRDTLHSLEKILRGLIERELAKLSPDWWSEFIPTDVRRRAEDRKIRRESAWPWYPSTSTNIADYLDFSDYRKIILYPSNWDQAFRSIFKVEGFVDTRLSELEPIRHDIAHSRPVSGIGASKLSMYAEELSACAMKTRVGQYASR